MFRTFDKATGRVIAEIELPGGTTGVPMTYLLNGKQYIVDGRKKALPRRPRW